jgi:hypothetical protein
VTKRPARDAGLSSFEAHEPSTMGFKRSAPIGLVKPLIIWQIKRPRRAGRSL